MKTKAFTAFALALLAAVLALAGGRPAAAFTASDTPLGPSLFSCDYVTEIPWLECRALVAVYDDTNGPGWSKKGGWKDTPTPCSWYGVTCASGHVTQLNLSDNKLSGPIPPALQNLTHLGWLRLGSNQLSGEIPPWLGSMTSLRDLLLYSNRLVGAIPPELGKLTGLARFSAYDNALSGEIPAELGNLSALWYLYLNRNQLSGPIPPQLADLVNLREFSLSTNQLSGSIPAGFGNLVNVQVFFLTENQLSGGIPPALGNLTQARFLSLGSNQLSGGIPSQLGNLTKVESLSLNDNPLSGPVPPELGALAKLERLALDNTQLSGALPQSLAGLQLKSFSFDKTDLCEPADPAFQAWLGAIPSSRRTAVCADANGSFSPDMGGALVYTSTAGSRVTISAPPHAVTETTYLVYTATVPSGANPDFAFAGVAFGLEAYQNGVLKQGFAFQGPITITIAYTDAQIAGLDESSLALDVRTESGWVDAATTCDPVSTYARNPAENLLGLNICHLSSFALFARELPVLARAHLPLTLRGTNP